MPFWGGRLSPWALKAFGGLSITYSRPPWFPPPLLPLPLSLSLFFSPLSFPPLCFSWLLLSPA